MVEGPCPSARTAKYPAVELISGRRTSVLSQLCSRCESSQAYELPRQLLSFGSQAAGSVSATRQTGGPGAAGAGGGARQDPQALPAGAAICSLSPIQQSHSPF